MLEVVIWQSSVSPHMTPLAAALARAGVAVTYIAERVVSSERAALGWAGTDVPNVRVVVMASAGPNVESLVASFSSGTVHLVQGLRRNGYLHEVIALLKARGARWGVMLESVRDTGMAGFLKRLDYRLALSWTRSQPNFVLAIGKDMPRWISRRGFHAKSVYPFTYFLEPGSLLQERELALGVSGRFVIGYVGVIETRKRIDVLISALVRAGDPRLHLSIIGSGSLAEAMKAEAVAQLSEERVNWREALPHAEVRQLMSRFDCLVLPSDFDGWGAVVSEALMSGVPAICSDACGAAEAVAASGVGGVFPRGNVHALSELLIKMANDGPPNVDRRAAISSWALSLCGDAGAKYLLDIIGSRYLGEPRPAPPWHVRPTFASKIK